MRNSIVVTLLLGLGLAPAFAAESSPTFTRDVAPIFMKSCATCHRPNDIAPMSLLSYDEVRPWAKSIRAAVSNRVMPPWDASPAVGKFRNDISLSDDEIALIERWVDAGAPQGDPADMPPAPTFAEGWRLGEPDYIVEMDVVEVPAEGDDLFVNKAFKLDLPEDQWVQAVEVQAGNKSVLHHLVTFRGYIEMGTEMEFINEVPMADRRGLSFDVLSIWAAGSPPTEFPEGMGQPIGKDDVLTFNMHLHPNGEATTDRSRIGIHFGKGPIQKKISTLFAMNTGLNIPAGAAGFTEEARFVFSQDSDIISFFPHMHVRGREMSYTLQYPDGKREQLLHVPGYDFNWQWIYYPEQHIRVPKGSVMEVVARYDNSVANEANPDPTLEVLFGDNTNDEMLIGFVEVVPAKGVYPEEVPSGEMLSELIEALPETETYLLEVNAGFKTIALALQLFDDGSAHAYFIDQAFTVTMGSDDVRREDNVLVMNSRFLINAGDTIPVGIRAEIDSDGTVTGGMYMGRAVDIDDAGAPTLKFTGVRLPRGETAAQTD